MCALLTGVQTCALPIWMTEVLARFLVRRAGTSVILLLGVVLVTFLLTVMVPGDPVRAALGEGASSNPATVAAYEEKYGLNNSVPERFVLSLANLLRGYLGPSLTTGSPSAAALAPPIPTPGQPPLHDSQL